jgi:hypothetical protein
MHWTSGDRWLAPARGARDSALQRLTFRLVKVAHQSFKLRFPPLAPLPMFLRAYAAIAYRAVQVGVGFLEILNGLLGLHGLYFFPPDFRAAASRFCCFTIPDSWISQNSRGYFSLISITLIWWFHTWFWCHFFGQVRWIFLIYISPYQPTKT